jgi:hypothetical protein
MHHPWRRMPADGLARDGVTGWTMPPARPAALRNEANGRDCSASAGGAVTLALPSRWVPLSCRWASLGLIIIGAQLHADPVYLGPAITFALVDFILPSPWPSSSATGPEDGTRAPARPPPQPPPAPVLPIGAERAGEDHSVGGAAAHRIRDLAVMGARPAVLDPRRGPSPGLHAISVPRGRDGA